MPVKSEVLNSWKEIASYMGRGVRTVQRWEHDLRLPVHRPKGRDHSSVLAIPAELDHWLLQTPMRAAENALPPCPSELVRRSRDLRERAKTLRADVQSSAQSQSQWTKKLTTTLRDVMKHAQRARGGHGEKGSPLAGC
jgi:hypothetical protein